MRKEEIVSELSEDVLAYVMDGVISEDFVSKNIKPENLSDRFEEYEDLMDLHFILKEEVVEFVSELPYRIRGIKTQTKNVSRVQRGEIEGRIDWESTMKERYSSNPSDRSLFVCNNRTENYNIDENIVLKKLLSVIYSTMEDSDEYLKEDNEWVSERWNETELIDRYKQIFKRNIHITRIKDPEEYEPDDRMLFTAENSRQDIYREAAELLKTRRRILEGDEEELRDLLESTAITPEDENTLFEIFVLFKFIGTLNSLHDGDFTLRTITTGRDEVVEAINSDGTSIKVYYDSSGPDQISFYPAPRRSEKRDEELTRMENTRRKEDEIVANYLDKREWETTGLPDIIAVEVSEGGESRYLITEVKNSTSNQKISEGVRETLEYLSFLRVKGENGEEFKFDEGSDYRFLGSGSNGVVVIQDIDGQHSSPSDRGQDDSPIYILQASELEENLKSIIEDALIM